MRYSSTSTARWSTATTRTRAWVEARVRPLIGMGGDKVVPALLDRPRESARRGPVALCCGGWSDTDLAGAVAIYDDPADLLSRYDDSPFACS